MCDFEAEMRRLADLDIAVRNYLSHLAAFEQGSERDESFVDYWRNELDMLTSGEMFETFGGDKFDKYGNPTKVEEQDND